MIQTLKQKVKRKLYEASSEFVYHVDIVKYSRQLPLLSESDQNLVNQLKQEGVVMTSLEELAIPSTPQLLRAANALLPDLEITEFTTAPSKNKQHAFSHSIPVNPSKIAKQYPEMFLWGLEDRILNILERYVGIPVACHGINMRRDIANSQQIGTRYWHIDGEDRTVVKILIYISDVDETCGPFEYIPKSLTPSYKAFKSVNYTVSDSEMANVVPPNQWRTCTGKAGTVIFVDTGQVFHHGKVPEKERTAIFFAYTSQRPKRPDLCQSSSFREALPLLPKTLSERQKQAIWKYQENEDNIL
ncbi:MAG: hypothetical protein ACOC0N_10915 [Chroococcales cyanobacterium]